LPENSRLSKVAVSKRGSSTPTPRIVTPDNLEMLMKPLNFNPDTFLNENEEMAENTTDLPFFHFLISRFLSKDHYRA